MKYELIWLSSAASDYVSLSSGEDGFNRWLPTLEKKLILLQEFPEMGTKVPFSGQLRRLLFGKNRKLGLYYSFGGARVYILALIDVRQKPEDIKNLLMKRLPGDA